MKKEMEFTQAKKYIFGGYGPWYYAMARRGNTFIVGDYGDGDSDFDSETRLFFPDYEVTLDDFFKNPCFFSEPTKHNKPAIPRLHIDNAGRTIKDEETLVEKLLDFSDEDTVYIVRCAGFETVDGENDVFIVHKDKPKEISIDISALSMDEAKEQALKAIEQAFNTKKGDK